MHVCIGKEILECDASSVEDASQSNLYSAVYRGVIDDSLFKMCIVRSQSIRHRRKPRPISTTLSRPNFERAMMSIRQRTV